MSTSDCINQQMSFDKKEKKRKPSEKAKAYLKDEKAPKRGKVVAAVSVVSNSVTNCSLVALVSKLRSAREEKREKQAADAETKGWSYDPRAKVVMEPTLYDLCVDSLSCLDEVVDYYVQKYTLVLNAGDKTKDFTVAENWIYSGATPDDLILEVRMSDEEVMSFGFTRLMQLVPATYICDMFEASEASGLVTAPQNKEHITAFLKDGIDMDKLLADHPHIPYFEDVTVIKSEEQDSQDDEDTNWCDKFDNHMKWLFQKFEERRCYSLGRIHAALGKPYDYYRGSLTEEFQALIISRIGGSCWRTLEAAVKNDDADFAMKRRLAPIVRHAVLSYPLDYRTYVGTFCYNIRESDYDGTLSGIVNFVGNMACEYFDVYQFVQINAVDGDVTLVDNLITNAFYIPGEEFNDYSA